MHQSNNNPWLARVATEPDVGVSLHGRPLNQSGKIIFEPFRRPNDPEITATDALLIGQLKATYVSIVHTSDLWLPNGPLPDPLIIMTPNANFLPDINLGQQAVYSRSDARWGPDDWTQWPQWYFADYGHLPYILRRPPKAELPFHPLSRVWWDMTEDDFVEEPECRFTGIGRLRQDIVAEFYKLRSGLLTEVSVQDFSQSPETDRRLQEAATSMRHAISILQHLPQTFANVLFTVTSAQRHYLETRAILDKALKFDRRNLGEKYEIDSSLMGTVTDRATLVFELFHKGVPVWFVRTVASVPKTTNIVRQDYPIQPGPSLGVVVKRWPNSSVLYSGPRSPSMYFPTNKWCPGSINFSNVGPESWDSQVPHEPQAASSSKRDVIPYPNPREVASKTRKAVTQISINNERFKISTSARSPSTTSEWAKSLQGVSADSTRILQHPQQALFRGYMFPDALAFLDDTRGCGYLLAWLVIRSSWMSTLTGIELRRVALPNPQQWRTYLHEIVNSLELLGEDKRKLRPAPQSSGSSRTARRKQKTRDTANEIFTCRKPNKDDLSTISWNHHVVWTRGRVDLQSIDFQLAVWDSYEHNFRAELISLDRCVMSEAWKDPQAGTDREQMLRAVFFDEIPLIASVPPGFRSIASQDAKDRCTFVDAFRLVLADWPGVVPVSLKTLQFREKIDGEVVWDFEVMHLVERKAYPFYCQTFFDYFGRAPSVPHTYPL